MAKAGTTTITTSLYLNGWNLRPLRLPCAMPLRDAYGPCTGVIPTSAQRASCGLVRSALVRARCHLERPFQQSRSRRCRQSLDGVQCCTERASSSHVRRRACVVPSCGTSFVPWIVVLSCTWSVIAVRSLHAQPTHPPSTQPKWRSLDSQHGVGHCGTDTRRASRSSRRTAEQGTARRRQ
jgi:hypothetical protein